MFVRLSCVRHDMLPKTFSTAWQSYFIGSRERYRGRSPFTEARVTVDPYNLQPTPPPSLKGWWAWSYRTGRVMTTRAAFVFRRHSSFAARCRPAAAAVAVAASAAASASLRRTMRTTSTWTPKTWRLRSRLRSRAEVSSANRNRFRLVSNRFFFLFPSLH